MIPLESEIMSALAQRDSGITGEVLVGQNAHRSGRYHGVDLFCLQGSASVAEAGLDILMC